MVLMNAAKAARNQASLINRGNQCGGTAKKAGLAPTVGYYISSNPNLLRAKNTKHGDTCDPFGYRHPLSMTRYRASQIGGTLMG